MSYDVDAVIIGAGIAGSSAAKVLADRGWSTVCFDRRLFPRHKVCGEFLSPESKRTLTDMGLQDSVAALQPSLIGRVRLSFGEGRPLELPLADPAYGVSRYRLDRALHEAAERSGVQMNVGTLITNVARKGDGFILDTRQGNDRQVLTARCVIVAWGNRPNRDGEADKEKLRQNSAASHKRIGLKSHFTGVMIDRAVELYFVPEGYVGIVRLDEDTVNVAALIRQDRIAGKGSTVQEKLDAVISRNRQLQQRLGLATPVAGSEAAVFPVMLNRKPHLWEEVPRIGDAGVMVPPLCGDGMSIALYTANVCARYADRYLSGEITSDEWRREYETDVQRAVRQPLRWGRAIHGLTDAPAKLRWLQAVAGFVPGVAARMIEKTRLGL